MSRKPTRDVLYDSEAALRQVDSAIRDMGGLPEIDLAGSELAHGDAGAALPSDLDGVSLILERGYREIISVLDSLRQSRSVLEKATLQKLAHTGDKLREVSNVTEVAATDILNGLERAAGMVDELDTLAAENDDARGDSVRATLRDELFALMGHMQFQDITSQQLAYASAVLYEMEERLNVIARSFNPEGERAPHEAGEHDPEQQAHFDADATTANREERQAVADEIVAAARRTP